MSSLSWSNTRITVLEYCQKKYFFNYYSNGLRRDYPALWKKAKILRKLKSLDMWMGEMTHKTIALYLHQLKNNILENGPEPDKTEIINTISKQMTDVFFVSKNNNYSDFIEFGLSEHFYNEIDDTALQTVIERVINNLKALIASDYHSQIIDRFRKGNHIYIEDPSNPNFDMMKVNTKNLKGLENISILAGPDFGIMFGEYKYLILDWKSGKEKLEISGITDQLRVYALKTILKQNSSDIGSRLIDVCEVYLPSLHEKKGAIQQEDIDGIIQKIKDDVSYQKQFIVDQDIERNIPLNHTNFNRTTHNKKCIGCTFRSICEELKEKETSE